MIAHQQLERAESVRPAAWGWMTLTKRWPPVESTLIVILAALVIGFLAWPMLFTSSGMAQDWSNHLWYLWRQSATISRDHYPSLFLNDGGSVFYPFYAFYGGTIYALFGTLAVALGDAPVAAYVISYVLGFAAAYGGWYSLARMAGLRRWQAQIPALLFISSAYYLTLVYARGDWSEFLAVSTLPLLVASGLRVLVADRVSLRWMILLAASSVVFFGSHNITMLWGVTALAVSALATVIVIPQIRRRVTLRRLVRVFAVVIPSALVNAWYLFPALAYGQRSWIATHYDYAGSLHSTAFLVSASNLFTFSRASTVNNTPDFVLALPLLAVAWVLVSIVLSVIHRGDALWRRMLWVLSALSLVFVLLMTHVGLLLALPRPYTLLQFSYRLETYVLLGLCGAVLATLVLARSWPRRWQAWSWTAVIVLIASGVGAAQQVKAYPRGNEDPGVVVSNRYQVFNPNRQPPFTGGLGDYNDATLPLVEPAGSPVGLAFPTAIHHERVTIRVTEPSGTLVHTNLTGAPYLVRVTGAKIVGRDKSGDMVLEVGPGRRSRDQITLSRSDRLPVTLGRLVTPVALAILVLMLAVCLIRRAHARQARPGG
ncbi:MAG TPA: hypothetical protein VNY35_09285 [Solirubrobacteraceae bacterium]|nr:hypothetical protein [Solirubrobacteraceae bacterium]